MMLFPLIYELEDEPEAPSGSLPRPASSQLLPFAEAIPVRGFLRGEESVAFYVICSRRKG